MSANSQPLSPEVALPIIIGVTGHRDLRPADLPQLRAQVGQIIQDLLRRYPTTPLLVLSPLAQGADQLVAKVALEQGARLAVPLPLALGDYEEDFKAAQSKQEFRELLKRAWKCFELPLLPGNTPAAVKANGPARDKQYALAGAYVAQHSHILIALWDGSPGTLVGGTAQIVDFKLNGTPPPYAVERKPLDIIDNGPVYHILTPRVKNPTPSGTPFELNIRFPEGWKSEEPLEKSFGRILQRMESFNRDVQRFSVRLAPEVEKNRNYVIPGAELSALTATARFILDRYAIADTLALHFQRRRKLTLLTLFVIAVMALLSFEVYAHLLPNPSILMLYPLALGIAVCIYALAKWQDYQNKHLDYRALAEGLRVQFFWNVAGLPDDVAEHYLRQHRTELDWIRNGIRAWNVVARNECDAVSPAEEKADEQQARNPIRLVIDYWIEDQRKFFTRARRRDHGKLERHDKLAKAFFIFGLLLAILVVAWHHFSPDFGEHSHYRHWLIVIMGISPAIGAAIGGYAEKMAYSAQAKRYDWMRSLFERATKQVAKLLAPHEPAAPNATEALPSEHDVKDSSDQAVLSLFLDLGAEALEENGDWVMVHRERTPDVYKGA
ncbi:MAG: hypothetical protein JWM21_2073 [Acidobacteria bacterium]|nr:hypothetical protein [Acidobacteriota bacterium]